jgi:hypothetical protein
MCCLCRLDKLGKPAARPQELRTAEGTGRAEFSRQIARNAVRRADQDLCLAVFSRCLMRI